MRVNFIPRSKFQFLIEFDFHGTIAVPNFTFTIQINPRYERYFSREDMSQIEIITVDPALLARFDEEETLSFGQISDDIELTE